MDGNIIMSAYNHRNRPEKEGESAQIDAYGNGNGNGNGNGSIGNAGIGADLPRAGAGTGQSQSQYRPALEYALAPVPQQQQQQQPILEIQQMLENPALQQIATTLATSIATATQQFYGRRTGNDASQVCAALAHSLHHLQPQQQQELFQSTAADQNSAAPPIYAALPSLLRTLQDSSNPSVSFSAASLWGVAPPAPVPVYHQPQLASNPSLFQIQGPPARSEMPPQMSQAAQAQQVVAHKASGDFGNKKRSSQSFTVPLFLDYDQQVLTQYQCLLRQQMELFEAGPLDVRINVRGRIKPLQLGQLGLRCRHCSMLPPDERTRGAVYFPGSVEGVYQIAQNMGKKHLCDRCDMIPSSVKHKLRGMFLSKDDNNRRAGGKVYWVESLAVLGVYEDKATGLLRLRRG
jgi:hypothetical protein